MLVAALADALGTDDGERTHALRAARLAKADQASRLVGEFAELEGYVGAVYARTGGLPEPVAVAIAEQYLPAAAGAAPAGEPGRVRSSPVRTSSTASRPRSAWASSRPGRAIPTGCAVPQRASSRSCSTAAGRSTSRGSSSSISPSIVEQGSDMRRDPAEVVSEVVSFVLDRVDAALGAEGVPTETQRAARGAGGADPLAHAELARALHAAGPELVAARGALERCRRIASKSHAEAAERVTPGLLRDEAEVELAQMLDAVAPRIAEAARRRDFASGLRAAAELAPAIDRFFTDVMVMDDDAAVRANRLRLMVDVVEATRPIGDLSALPG